MREWVRNGSGDVREATERQGDKHSGVKRVGGGGVNETDEVERG